MNNFIKEIKILSQRVKISENKKFNGSENNEALEILFDIAKIGINTLKETNSSSVNLYRLPADLMPLFFNFQNDCGGFVIRTEKKFIFVTQNKEKRVFIYGLAIKDNFPIQQITNRRIQLLSLEYKAKKGKIEFYDSTNKTIKPEDVVLEVMKWGLS